MVGQVARHLGERKERVARQILGDYRVMGIFCGLFFMLRFVIFREATIEQYSSDVEDRQDDFEALSQDIWTWVILYQVCVCVCLCVCVCVFVFVCVC